MSAAEDVLVGSHNSVIGNARTAFHQGRLIEETFNLDLGKLPGVDWLKTIIVTDQQRWGTETCDWESTVKTSTIRSEYVKWSFPILTDEFLHDVVSVILGLGATRVIELCAGTGWLTHWLRIYGLEIEAAIDNKSWLGFEGRYLPLVKEADSVEYVQAYPETDLFILSWPPYEGDLAYRVWEAMGEGAYLLYIGEGEGGCTGDDAFFNALPEAESETAKLRSRFISFWGIHDQPALYRKKRGRQPDARTSR